MTVQFRMKPHTIKENTMIVEVWENDVLIGAIYPADKARLLIFSKFGVKAGQVKDSPVPGLEVKIG